MNSKIKNMDKALFLLMLIFTILGLVMLFSASSMTAVLQYGKSESFFFVRQLVFVIAAYIVGFIILFLPDRMIEVIKKMSKLIAIAAIGLLIITKLFGSEINGARSWIDLGPVNLQPSEFVKTMTILFLAFAFSNQTKMFKNYKFLVPFTFSIVCIFLIAIQPDLGTAMILACISFLMFLCLPIKNKKYTKLKLIAGIIATVCACLFFFGEGILKNTNI